MTTTSPLPGISLQVTVTIAPENVSKFLELFQSVYEKVIAEPECTFFEVYHSPENPGVLSWVENWYLLLSFFLLWLLLTDAYVVTRTQSIEWLFQNQFSKEYYKEYLETTEPMFLKPREAKILKRLSPFIMVKKTNGLD
jgi:quinol monooxygenase YgiN